MSRIPIRLRLAAAFAVAMALVLSGTGLFLYTRLGDDLARSLDQDLRLRSQDLTALVSEPGGSLRAATGGRLVERGESFAQLVGVDGRVLEATTPLGGASLLRADELRAALRRPEFLDRPSVPGLDERARVLATSVGRGRVLVVGATLENRAEALRNLRTELLVAGPVALLLATGLGYLLAGGGLRAVEAMRRRAAELSGDRPGERLPVPRSGDELERLGHTLNELLGRLEAAVDRERGFVAEAGHELRTPLTLIRAELDYALHHAEGEAELREAIREAGAETDRLVQLAEDLLLLATSDSGKLRLRREPLVARDLLDSVRNRFLWRAEESGRPIAAEAADRLSFRADRLRLEQALGNLVENALRHGEGAVQLAALAVDGRVELHVRDGGEGFPPAFLPHAFERFSRGEAARSSGGAGLGLAIVEAIARSHGGTVQASNATPRGADVWLSLPD